jgi:UDPglucose 6-dehydrogenase
VASNPEFLKEGAAVQDFMKPDRIVLGVDSTEAEAALRELYEPFVRSGNPLLFMDIPSAEVTKYAANATLAARITLMNQFANLCEKVGADVEQVRRGIGSDARIGKAFLFPGPGYGGSCFPKDVKALCATGRDVGAPLEVLECVESVNERQKRVPVEKLRRALGSLKGTTVAVWGLAFKAQTDDMREAASLVVVEELLAAGAKLRVHDPKALAEARRRFGDRVTYVEHRYDALDGADALVILTEWQEYRVLDYDQARRLLKRRVVVDARNLYEPARMREHGFTYDSIGRR